MSDENGPLNVGSLLCMLQVGSGGEEAANNDSNESNNIGSPRRSVRGLLRSKVMPCTRVLEVTTRTKGSLTAQILMDAHKVLLEEYATFTTKPGSIEKLSSLSSSSFDQIKQLVVIIRFAQLILLRKPLVERNQTLPSEKCHQLVSELLQKTSQGLCHLVESSRKMKEKQDQQETTGEENIDDEEDDNIDAWTVDASTTSDLRPVIIFSVCSFLRINSHYAKTEVALIAPIWKGICDVLTASTTSLRHCLPPEPLEEALKALSSYLVEGRDRLVLLYDANNTTTQCANTSTAPTPSSPSNTFPTLQVKLLTFLLRRAAALLKLVPNPENSSLVHSICQLFAGFRGMAPVFQLPKNRCQMSSSHVCFEIGTKIQKIVSELAVSHPPCWIALLQKDCGYVDHHNEIIQTSPSVGLALLLQWILKKAMQSPDIKSYEKPMLRTCEYLLFQALPRCYDTLEQAQFLYASTRQQSTSNPMIGTLLHTSLQAMKNVLVRIGQNEDFLRGHRLLCRWMDQRHPLARELSVSLAYLFWMETKSIAFLSLLVKLLFDCRTKQLLRTNLSALLIRILRSNPDSQSTTEKLIEAEFLVLLKFTSRTEKKRKRSTTANNVGWAYYKYEDIQAIFNTLQHGGNTSQSQSIIRTFCHKISSKGCRVRLTSAKRIALQGAILHGWLGRYGENQQHHGGITDVQQHFQNIVGFSLRDLLLAFLRLIDNEVLKLKDDCSLELAECNTILTISLLRICGGLCNLLRDCVDAHSGSPIATSQICRILKVCTNIYMRAPSSAVSKYQRSILFEAVFFLRSFGNFIPSSCPDSALKDVQQIFFHLASSSHWPIQSYALSAMTAFGGTLHKSHQSILPRFLPRRCTVLFQSRVHGFNLRKEQLRSDGKEKNGEDDCLALSTRDQCRKLEVYIQPRNVGSNLFPSAAAIQIAKGSYLLKMSIEAGRDALVILPPGPQSIEDAHYRLGDERQEILSLKRCTISQNGDGECLLECQVHVVEA